MSTAVASTHLDAERAAALLTDVQHGRRGAFDELVRLCEPFVRCQATMCAWRRDDVDDVVQEVWIRLFVHARTIRDPATLVAWLRTVVRRLSTRLGYRGSRLVPSVMSDALAAPCDTEDAALGSHSRDAEVRGVNAALARFSDADRTLVLLLHRDGRPNYNGIGAAVGRPVGSLGPTRRRLLDRLGRDAQLNRLRVCA